MNSLAITKLDISYLPIFQDPTGMLPGHASDIRTLPCRCTYKMKVKTTKASGYYMNLLIPVKSTPKKIIVTKLNMSTKKGLEN